MYRSKAKATDEEVREIVRLHKEANKTPVIAMSMAHGMNSGGFAGDARKRANEVCHSTALSHGLAEQEGSYGLDPQTGEFLSQYPIKETTCTEQS